MQRLFNNLKGGMFRGPSEPVCQEASADNVEVTYKNEGLWDSRVLANEGDGFFFFSSLLLTDLPEREKIMREPAS